MSFPSDRRSSERIKTENLAVEFRFATDTLPFTSDVINISSGGICFLRNAPIKKEDILYITFPFKAKKIVLKAQVMRIEGREAGLKFLNDPEVSEDMIAIFHREHSKHAYEKKPSDSRTDDLEEILDLRD
jgi:hypothetical protein